MLPVSCYRWYTFHELLSHVPWIIKGTKQETWFRMMIESSLLNSERPCHGRMKDRSVSGGHSGGVTETVSKDLHNYRKGREPEPTIQFRRSIRVHTRDLIKTDGHGSYLIPRKKGSPHQPLGLLWPLFGQSNFDHPNSNVQPRPILLDESKDRLWNPFRSKGLSSQKIRHPTSKSE